MEQYLLILLTILSLITTEVTSLQCYRCQINTGVKTNNSCLHFDHSQRYIVNCDYSTMCMKHDFSLDIQNGVRIKAVLRDCAPQKHEYQSYEHGRWIPKIDVEEPYEEGCLTLNDKGERATQNRYCYCRGDLCNSSPSATHEGYTDIMGVIVVFNLMKYINSLR